MKSYFPLRKKSISLDHYALDHYALIGNPVHQSQSPFIHHWFAEQTQQQLKYSLLLTPLDGLEQALTNFQSQGGKGVNITMPFKQQAFSLVDSLSERATQAQAINTIRFDQDGTRFGDNTDGIGLIRDLYRQKITLRDKSILLFGAGGAARGILHFLLAECPAEIFIANRTANKAYDLAKKFSVHTCTFPELGKDSFDVIINSTGASLQDDLLQLPPKILNEDSFCYDISYGQGMTPFLQWGQTQGALCSNGLGMLVEQAAESFYLWRGIKPNTQLFFQK